MTRLDELSPHGRSHSGCLDRDENIPGMTRFADPDFTMTGRVAALVAVLALLGAAACGGGAGPTRAVESPSASPSLPGVPAGAAQSPTASPAPPQGGPVPAELAGAWKQVAQPSLGLNFSGTTFAIGYPTSQSPGNVAVNGSQIDFYNSVACGIRLPAGIGSYRWTISAGLLVFTPLNSDPCERGLYLADPKGWQRAP